MVVDFTLKGRQKIELINQMFFIFAPSIVAVFIWGIISRKGTANAAFYALLGGSFFAACIFQVEKYMVIDGIENYISSSEGLGINWLRQTYIYFILSSIIYLSISYFDKSVQEIPEEFYLKVSTPSKLINYLSILLVGIMLTLYSIFY